MSVTKDRASPSGPVAGFKAKVEIQRDTIPAQSTVLATAALPANSAHPEDAVTVNPFGPLQTGVVIGATRISSPDTLEVEFGNLTGMAIDPASVVLDVFVRKF